MSRNYEAKGGILWVQSQLSLFEKSFRSHKIKDLKKPIKALHDYRYQTISRGFFGGGG